MRAESHWNKAERIESTRLKKLNGRDDYELAIWSCIHGAAHLVNAALHHMRATEDAKDYIHSFKVESGTKLPQKAVELMELLHQIEIFGPRFVRGAEIASNDDFSKCVDTYNTLKQEVAKILAL